MLAALAKSVASKKAANGEKAKISAISKRKEKRLGAHEKAISV